MKGSMENGLETSIELQNLTFAYPSASHRQILNIPHWSVSTGEHVFIHGASGGGKSTLLNILSGVLSCSSGEISVLGKPFNSMSKRQRDRFRAEHIGVVFQQFNLIPYLNAEENIRLAHVFSKKRQQTNLTDEIHNLLNTLNLSERDWQRPAAKLSIGQQQRVAIARALINQPEILIADEPTSSLDEDNRNAFMSELMSLVEKKHCTLIFVSHDMRLSHYFSRVQALNEINSLASIQEES